MERSLKRAYKIAGRITFEAYGSIIEAVLLAYVLDEHFPDRLFWLQQEGAPVQTAREIVQLLDYP